MAQNVFNNKLVANVVAADIPVNPGSLLQQGATQIAGLVEGMDLEKLKGAYNLAITQVSHPLS